MMEEEKKPNIPPNEQPEDIVPADEPVIESKGSKEKLTDPNIDALNETHEPSESEKHYQEISDAPMTAEEFKEMIDKKAKEEETESPYNFSLRDALGGTMLQRIFKNQIPMVMLIAFTIIAYITCRYHCQKLMVEADQIEKKIEQQQCKRRVFSSSLTSKSRESRILEELSKRGDTLLVIPTDPPYKIEVPEE